MSLLQVTGLVKRYGGFVATDHFGMTIEPGEIHAVIGPNGAGKSTLIAQLAGELRPDAGMIKFDGRDVTSASISQRARLGLTRSYQITSVLPDYTALQNVMLAVNALGPRRFSCWGALARQSRVREPALELLERVGLAQRAHVSAAQMAHGEHRQLELAMALAGRPKLLLLDEPMAGMSQAESENMTAQLRELKGRHAMLLVEHDMDAVFALADRITVLVYGKPIATGRADEIRIDPRVREAYLGDNTAPHGKGEHV
ncbi:ABC transporter ATP-binding protein [Mycetohabitans sp. B5]|uniref:Amino acid/amide ABC transporter ATP-binding protein 1 (HAAT family) n=1 Tax=Mycetohabitans endofungorum TaxID=417203 RepID=A0A2P5KCA3_9BURK|nr:MULTISPECIES: ABC transporter ATP-binding protein [Mycetohabitans]MCG1054558.1 ABC transporter ATP-binding protein [Mycetohabitans sp. B5]PPB84285.1 amino acid/amide ABC transporter ATP-binding protein 1 (HAAT family) [Mycetohabitans endofungorum]